VKISGEFEVSLKPLSAYAVGQDGINLGRMSIDKTFVGELKATSKGEMLSALTPVKGSAGYVAIEQIVGSLSGMVIIIKDGKHIYEFEYDLM
jgi:hypothetical protein